MAARGASGLASIGVGEGDAIALLLRNDTVFLEATIATGMVGAYAVPMNWHERPDGVGYILEDSGAKVLVAHADLLEAISGSLDLSGRLVLRVPTTATGEPEVCPEPETGLTWAEWANRFEPMAREKHRRPASMIYTSGTTGRPKGVRRRPLDSRQAAAVASMNQSVLGIRPGMRTVIPAPLYHTAPNAYTLGALLNRAFVVLRQGFDAEGLLADIETYRVTHLQLVPTMFVRLLKLPEAVRARYDHSSLEHVVHAAAPCPPEVKRQMIDWWGPVIHEYYGSTESGAVTYCDSDEWLAHPGTVGRPVEGGQVRIVGPDGSELPQGEPGEVYTYHPALGDFTYQGNDEARRSIELDGMITSGDIGYLDEDGYLYLCGRAKELVISGGVNIYPAEVEAALISLPGVRDCAVFGIPDADLGEALAAAVEPEPGTELSERDVTSYLRARLGTLKTPRLVTFHDALPREDSGKIFKRRLRDPYWQRAGRSI